MIDFTSFGKLIPDSVQLHYSLSTASLQLPYSLNSYRSLYPQVQLNKTKLQKLVVRELCFLEGEIPNETRNDAKAMALVKRLQIIE